MHTYESLKHTTWECKYHVVFIPKYRRKSLYAQLRRDLGAVFRDLAEQKECKVEEGHLMPDHVHMLVQRAAEVFGGQRDGVYQGQERNSHCASLCWAAEELRGPAFLGAGLLGIDGRQERGCGASIYPRTGERRPTPRTTGDDGALSASR